VWIIYFSECDGWEMSGRDLFELGRMGPPKTRVLCRVIVKMARNGMYSDFQN
jgi:hypothetical protein